MKDIYHIKSESGFRNENIILFLDTSIFKLVELAYISFFSHRREIKM
jgi:hypothetical protein